jgi:hypothetical protein
MTQEDQDPSAPRESWFPSGASPSFTTDWSPTSGAAPTIVLQYQLTQEEVVTGLRRVLRRVRRFQILFALGAFLIVLGVLMMIGSVSPPFGAFCALLGFCYIAAVGLAIARGPRRAWRSNAALREPQLVAFSPEGVYARSTNAEARSRWNVYAAMIETERCYLLRLAARRVYVFIPKRAFASSTEEEAFRNLVGQHMRTDLQPAKPI